MQPFESLEGEFAAWAGVKNVVGCASGTAALHLALETLQLPPGSEVITSDYNMVAVPRAIVMAGLVPVFVDCGDDLLMDMKQGANITHHNASAIMPVHIYGRRCDMDWMKAAAEYYRLAVIEDLSEAHGVKPHPSTDAACWSFFRNKIVAGEEGGCIAFNNPEYAAPARQLRCLGFTADHDYNHIPRGWNHRLSNAHAELIRDSLAVADANIFCRRQIEAMYEARCPRKWKMPARDAVWVYDLRIKGMTSEQQNSIVCALKDVGIQARHGFKPMSSQQEFKHCRVIGKGNAARLASEIIYLPVQPGITTESDVHLSFDIIEESMK